LPEAWNHKAHWTWLGSSQSLAGGGSGIRSRGLGAARGRRHRHCDRSSPDQPCLSCQALWPTCRGDILQPPRKHLPILASFSNVPCKVKALPVTVRAHGSATLQTWHLHVFDLSLCMHRRLAYELLTLDGGRDLPAVRQSLHPRQRCRFVCPATHTRRGGRLQGPCISTLDDGSGK